MGEKPVDRRVRRTHRRLKEALLELIEERDYERITVEEITERADVARSTFYAHFGSKEDLLFSGFDAWVLGLVGQDVAAEEPLRTGRSGSLRFSLPLLRHMSGQGRFVRALLLAPEARLRRRVTRLIAAVIRKELGGSSAARSEARALDAQAFTLACAFLGVAAWWITEGRGLRAEQVDAIFQRAVGRPG